MKNAADVVASDLSSMVEALRPEWPSYAGRRVLVTGGAGFLGYYFTQAVAAYNREASAGERVELVALDNFARGTPRWLSELAERRELRLLTHDMREPLPMDLPPVHYIVHAASVASPTYYRAHPIETMDANVSGLRHLLDYARAAAGSRDPVLGLLFLSSSEIYGDPDPSAIPTPETYRGLVSCTGPRACYDEAKRYGETLCVAFARQHGVPTRIARPFNNYGPGLKINDGRVLPDFARDALAGRDIVMLSDGSATRTFCYASDAIVGYYKVLARGGDGEPYNIGVETPEISMRQLAEMVTAAAGRLFGYRGRVVCKQSTDREYLIDNPNRRCPIIDKARQQVGYNPSVSFEAGLERSLLWYQGNQEAAPEPWSSTTSAAGARAT